MSGIDEAVYVETVRQAIKTINPAVTDAAAAHGWPAALDAVSTILMSLLIAAAGADEARSACGRMYEDVARLERAWAPVLAQAMVEEPRGRA
jgi:hypothetical protein